MWRWLRLYLTVTLETKISTLPYVLNHSVR